MRLDPRPALRGPATVLAVLLVTAAFSLGHDVRAGPVALRPSAPDMVHQVADEPVARIVRDLEAARALAAAGDHERALGRAEGAVTAASATFGTTHPYVAFAIDVLVQLQIDAGYADDAIRNAELASTILERTAPSSDRALVIANLGRAYAAAGAYRDAIPAYQRALDMLGATTPASFDAARDVMRNMAIAQREMGRLDEARDLFAAILAEVEAQEASTSALLASSRLDLVSAQLGLEDFDAAASTLRAAKTIVDGLPISSPLHFDLAMMQVRLALVQSRLTDADGWLEQAAGLVVPDDGTTDGAIRRAQLAYNRGYLAFVRGQFVSADDAYREALLHYRRGVGADHPAVARTLHNLGLVQLHFGEFEEAENDLRQAIAIRERLGGPDDADAAATRNELAALFIEWERFSDAENEARLAADILHRQGMPDGFRRGVSFSVLGAALLEQGRTLKAGRALEQAVAIMDATRPETSDLAPALLNLSRVRLAQKQLEDAQQLADRAVAIRERDGAWSGWGMARALHVRARVERAMGESSKALATLERAVEAAVEAIRTADPLDQRARASMLGEREIFFDYLDVAVPLLDQEPDLASTVVRVAQLPHLTMTAAALREAVARLHSNDPELDELLELRRATADRRRALDAELTGALRSTASGNASAALIEERETVIRRARALRDALESQHPDVAQLLAPRPAELTDLQAALGGTEAVLLHVAGETGSVVVMLTRERAFARSSSLSESGLMVLVDRLREGVSNRTAPKIRSRLFDVEAAHELYTETLGLVNKYLPPQVDQLFVTPSGALQQIPFALLLDTPAPRPAADYGSLMSTDFTAYQELSYVVRRFAINTLPVASALPIARIVERFDVAEQPFYGVGDPLLGEALQDRHRPSSTELHRRLQPLPLTRMELLAMAESFGVGHDALMLGEHATEDAVKAVPLDRYRVVVFATHGLSAGESGALREPALVLTPAAEIAGDEDGLLTASEITQMRLNADWVILSACDTAAGLAGGDALSGLARAFLFAGARSLLVSHWDVPSQSTARLASEVVRRAAVPAGPSFTQSLRLAMLDLIDDEEQPHLAHPRFWAPFAIVGGL
ncbi:MAG: CHAT domain-containing tetratricopeptide repeat protein [Pseudomonadota bacterium]